MKKDVETRGREGAGEMDRREAIASMGAGALAAYGVGTPSWDRYQQLVRDPQQAPLFFSAAELATLRVLADIIIPRDAKSGAATDAGSIGYMDFVVSEASERTKTSWREGLRWYDEESTRRFNKPFVLATPAERIQIVELVAWPARAAAELRPQVDFFNRLRDLTASAFFSSRMGVEDLGFLGGVVNMHWTGAPAEALRELGVSYTEWDQKYGNAPARPTGPTPSTQPPAPSTRRRP